MIKRPATAILAGAIALGALLVGVTGARRVQREAPCGSGFVREGSRCLPVPGAPCPDPLVSVAGGCDAPSRAVVDVPATRVLIGPSDWEAEGKVAARTIDVRPFALDRFEVTVGRARETGSPLAALAHGDPGRALGGVTLVEARAYCAFRGGRLPTDDEWVAAAAGDRPRRYPWGDTGAVCRRAAWGLVRGPCGRGATGPDSVGAHPEGATPLGVHDLGGNVAEWVEAPGLPPGRGAARGGSYETDMATALRTWVRVEVDEGVRSPAIGLRCAYQAAPPGVP